MLTNIEYATLCERIPTDRLTRVTLASTKSKGANDAHTSDMNSRQRDVFLLSPVDAL